MEAAEAPAAAAAESVEAPEAAAIWRLFLALEAKVEGGADPAAEVIQG